MNEWAGDLKRDPVDVRLRHIADARLREVIERTAARFGWGRARSGNGRGFGMSCNIEKDARLALFVEAEADGARVRIVRMAATGDFGAALNPDALRNQMTGALIQGIGGALWEQVMFDGTAQVTRRLAQYRVPRFIDVPAMDVQLIDRRDVASAGAGESPITPDCARDCRRRRICGDGHEIQRSAAYAEGRPLTGGHCFLIEPDQLGDAGI